LSEATSFRVNFGGSQARFPNEYEGLAAENLDPKISLPSNSEGGRRRFIFFALGF